MDVTLVGEGPAADAVAAALSDVDATLERGDPVDLAGADLGVVTGDIGDAVFAAANETAREAAVPWLSVEAGGLGGHAVDGVRAAAAGFAPSTGCFACLRTRVVANLDGGTDGGAADGGPADGATDDGSVAGGADRKDGGVADGEPPGGAADARLAGAVAGREAARLLDGGESSLLGGVVEVPHAGRRFLPVPGCPVCADPADKGLTASHRERSLEAALAAAERALDDRVGVVHEVGEAESYPAPYYLARLADTSGFSDASAAGQAAGVDDDWNAAFMKALGEALERYSAGVYRSDAFRRGRPGDVAGTVDPRAFVGVDGDAGEPIPWVPGRELTDPRGGGDSGDGTAGEDADGGPAAGATDGAAADRDSVDEAAAVLGEAVWLPAEFVHFPPPERRFGRAITTGLGLGSGTVDALRSGLAEVLERDATMLAWYSTYEPLGLAVDDERYAALARRARSEGLTVTAMLVTQDVDVPVVAVAVHREGEWPQFAVGSGAALDPTAAARSGLAEALQNWMELRAMGPADAAGEAGAIGRYADFPRAAREFVDVERTVPADSVGAAAPSGPAALATLVERTRAAGLAPYAARVTPRDVASLGFEAVRVVAPGAQPLFTDEPTFGERARTVPPSLGFEPRPDREFHPYP